MTKYFRVKNWDKFQHYKDRSPPWIKLHNHLLDNYEFECLNDATKGHLLCIWMLASRTNNKMIYEPAWIKRKIGANSQIDLKTLIDTGFIELQGMEHDASKSLDSEEKRRDREETEDNIDRFDEFWNLYDKKQQKPKCLSKWKRLNKSDRDLIFKKLPAYIKSTPDKSFRKNPLTWLNGECWNDEIICKNKNNGSQDYDYSFMREVEFK